MRPTQANIKSVVLNSDKVSVTVKYSDQDGAVYSIQLPIRDTPNNSDPTAKDNYDYFSSLITGA